MSMIHLLFNSSIERTLKVSFLLISTTITSAEREKSYFQFARTVAVSVTQPTAKKEEKKKEKEEKKRKKEPR